MIQIFTRDTFRLNHGKVDRILQLILILVCLSNTAVVHAQSEDNTLKLGEPTQEAPTLDLGAPAQAPAPPGPEVVTPAIETEPGGAASENVQRERFGAWDVACPPSGRECAMAQIGNDASGTPVLEMVVRKLDEPLEVGDRTAIAVLDVITPLGVVLTEGLSVTIDGGQKESAPFQICTEQGCLVREPVDNDLISRLKRGNSAVISVIAANQGEVKATLSLSGFTKAYNGL